MENLVFNLEPGEKVHCYFCLRQMSLALYMKSDAFLAGPGHSPLDGNANYVCRAHLDEDAIIDTPSVDVIK